MLMQITIVFLIIAVGAIVALSGAMSGGFLTTFFYRIWAFCGRSPRRSNGGSKKEKYKQSVTAGAGKWLGRVNGRSGLKARPPIIAPAYQKPRTTKTQLCLALGNLSSK
eukprot:GHVR01145946.1.p1 GENE.GHVR01145946.1~~GHVR01145946.1.p1  ORF type:complete len:109 (-),score=1.19 GHVR01145946.1:296-622(-)